MSNAIDYPIDWCCFNFSSVLRYKQRLTKSFNMVQERCTQQRWKTLNPFNRGLRQETRLLAVIVFVYAQLIFFICFLQPNKCGLCVKRICDLLAKIDILGLNYLNVSWIHKKKKWLMNSLKPSYPRQWVLNNNRIETFSCLQEERVFTMIYTVFFKQHALLIVAT